VYICNPNNPTGNLVSLEYIEKLLANHPETLFLIDEAYFEFTGVTAKDLIFKYENLLISRTMSKAFALASFRIGYLLSYSENILTISKVRNPKNFTTFAQVAAIAALSDIQYMKNYVKEVHLAKMQFVNFIKSMDPFLQFFNTNGNFLLIRVSEQKDKKGLITELEKNNVFVRDFTHSRYLLDCFRITIGTREQMKFVENVIRRYFKQ
jgi:histidinol-phosphate aminotransferase